MNSIKVVFAGDDGIGKISLIVTLNSQEFPPYVPPAFDYLTLTSKNEEQFFQINLWDIISLEEYSKLLLYYLIFPKKNFLKIFKQKKNFV